MSRLILIRHGETDWNVDGRWQGQADVPLNARGIAQAEETAQSLSNVKFAAIYSSDLARARQTAEVLARVAGLPLRLDPRLREIHQGAWQGLRIPEIEARYAEAFRRRRENPLTVAPPGGETVLQVQARVLAAVADILARHPGQTVAVVSHGFALALILAHFRGVPTERVWDLIPRNGEINVLKLEES
ncbi:MAG TPA: histidine phosphatase family protein [Anaerolineales bacterium]|nr:histidine phosphatase family protein [Anaerolineales bacterium]